MVNRGLLVCALAACGHRGFAYGGDADSGSTGDGPRLLSCSGLAATCGPTGTASCCGSALVMGGTFYRSYDVATDGSYADMTSPATVSDFRLDTYEVTVGRFRKFVNAGMGTQASPPPVGAGARTLNGMASQGGWDPSWNTNLSATTSALTIALPCDGSYASWTDLPGANEALPINCITWYEAFAFCAWDAGFLPTDAEWNYAVAGGSEQRAYPWSNPASSLTIDCSYANYGSCTNPPVGGVNRVGSESRIGDGKFGQADLAGNVCEWTLDWYMTPYGNPCTDCADLVAATWRVLRGGCYNSTALSDRGADRAPEYPQFRTSRDGIRCARPP